MRPEFQGDRVSSIPVAGLIHRFVSGKTGWLLSAALALASGACTAAVDSPDGPVATAESASSCGQDAVGLALQVENGAGVPLQVRAGQTFYVNQIDVRASLTTNVDEGLDGLKQSGDFAGLQWDGLEHTDSDVSGSPNPDNTWDHRRYFRSANWMKKPSSMTLEQLDVHGHPLGQSVSLDLGIAGLQSSSDSFFIRRMRGIQWTHDCASPTDCTGASHFEEEALIEVRHALDSNKTPFKIHHSAKSLRLTWSLRPGSGWIIPVTQVAMPAYDYGFSIDIAILTPPGPNGTYAPGSDITFQATLRDGSGNRLHPAGTLPSFFQAEVVGDPSGIHYYGAFFDPTIVYYRRKHMEGFMIEQLIGPAQDVKSIHTVLDFGELTTQEIQNPATPARDGFYAQAVMFPRGTELFGGAFDPEHAAWFEPVSDTWTHHIPSDAKPGTYRATMKARRAYLGEDLQATRTISLQVGSPAHTSTTLQVGGCQNCHTNGGSLAEINHANPDLGACSGCHVPLPNELQGPVYVRTHFIHSRSGRFNAPLTRCASCHLTSESIQRTSKSACISCHTTYPDSHVAAYGPISDPFVGGGPNDSFSQCSTTCHVTHPSSGLH